MEKKRKIDKNKKTLKVSFVVPCHNVEKFLPKCLNSLLAQTLDDIEIICVNDGSSDGTLKVLRSYEKKYSNITVINKKNEGVLKARLTGADVARGEYIGFVDSDDYVMKNYAERLFRTAKKHGADISVCGFARIDSKTNKPYSKEMCKVKYPEFDIQQDPGLLIEINTAPWNKIYRIELIKKIHVLSHPPKILEDMLFLQLVYLEAKKIVFTREPLYCYMVREGSAINSVDDGLLPDVYSSMKEVKDIYKKENPGMLEYLDGSAFLHLGVSLMYRLSGNENFGALFSKNIEFMNRHFPHWKKNAYFTRKYIRSHNGVNKKISVMKKIYDLHMFKLFLWSYNFMINRIKIDFKW